MISETAYCRICLSTDVHMHVIAHTPLQEVYEKLTNIALNSDTRPAAACYICQARLRNSYKLMQTSLQAEKLLKGILENNEPTTNAPIIMQAKSLLSLFVTPVEYITTEVVVKCEPDVQKAEVKNEETSESVQPKDAPVSDIDDDNHFSDSEDDIPLKNFSLKQEKVTVKKKEGKPTRGGKIAYKINAKEIILTKEEQMEELLARAKTSNYIDSPYKCSLCYKGFVDAKAYDNHKEKHDEKSGAFACDICHMRYRTARHLRTHAATSHGRHYRCGECGHRSHTANQAREHDRWHKGYTYECQLCGQKFRKPTTYLTHMRRCHPTEHVCEMCGESFVGRHGLLMHKSKTHRHATQLPNSTENASDAFCVDCNIQFVSSDAWKRHILSSFKHKANNQDSSECRICGETVVGSLGEHFRSHARSLRSPRDNQRATPLAKLPCQQCGGLFASKSRLAAHTRRAHLGLKYNMNIVCEVCGKHCSSHATLKYHQRTHTGEKPFKCTSCNKRFSNNNHLTIHTRTHTGEKPYSCPSCGKRFTQKPALNRHQRVHTGVKPYECQYCCKRFSQSNSLNIHIKSVHLKLPVVRKKTEKTQEELALNAPHTVN